MSAPTLRVLSLGAGRQSSTLLYMSIEGELEPLDLAVFADTQREPRAVRAHVAYLQQLCHDAKVPLRIVSVGNIVDDYREAKRFAAMPLFTLNRETGEVGRLQRQCTRDYKIDPIRREIRSFLGVKPKWPVPRGVIVEQWIGFSLNELMRVKPSRDRWVRMRYPLIERRMHIDDLRRWCEEKGYPWAPKSSCIECPYHDDTYWRQLREDAPADFSEACEFDAWLRGPDAAKRLKVQGEVYLHRSCTPLAEVDLRTDEDRGQLPMFTAEAEVCGDGCFT